MWRQNFTTHFVSPVLFQGMEFIQIELCENWNIVRLLLITVSDHDLKENHLKAGSYLRSSQRLFTWLKVELQSAQESHPVCIRTNADETPWHARVRTRFAMVCCQQVSDYADCIPDRCMCPLQVLAMLGILASFSLLENYF